MKRINNLRNHNREHGELGLGTFMMVIATVSCAFMFILVIRFALGSFTFEAEMAAKHTVENIETWEIQNPGQNLPNMDSTEQKSNDNSDQYPYLSVPQGVVSRVESTNTGTYRVQMFDKRELKKDESATPLVEYTSNTQKYVTQKKG